MRSLVVPLDESMLAEEALPWAGSIARALQCELHLVSVQPTADMFWEFADVDPRLPIEAHRETLRGYLEQVRRTEQLRGLRISTEVIDGEVVAQLTWLVARVDAALVVITTRGRGGAAAGSTSRALVRSLPTPVLVVPPGAPLVPIDAVLVPLDGSEASLVILPEARALASAMGATIHLLLAVDPDLAWGLPEAEGAEYLAHVKRRAANDLAAVAQEGEVPVVREGRAVDAILDYAGENGCRVIAMATRTGEATAPGGLQSVADEILAVTDRPLLLVARGRT